MTVTHSRWKTVPEIGQLYLIDLGDKRYTGLILTVYEANTRGCVYLYAKILFGEEIHELSLHVYDKVAKKQQPLYDRHYQRLQDTSDETP